MYVCIYGMNNYPTVTYKDTLFFNKAFSCFEGCLAFIVHVYVIYDDIGWVIYIFQIPVHRLTKSKLTTLLQNDSFIWLY